MKVRLRRYDLLPEEQEELALMELDLEVVPRVGEQLFIQGDERWDHVLDWRVQAITYELQLGIRGVIEQTAVVSVALMSAPPCQVWIEWASPRERPSWLSDEVVLACYTVPRQGDIIEIGINDIDFDSAAMVVVEVVAVAHNTLKEPGERDLDILGATQIGLIVRSAERSRSDVQRVLARHN